MMQNFIIVLLAVGGVQQVFGIEEDRLKTFFNSLDSDDDGSLSEEERKDFTDLFTPYDLNKDNHLDLEEFKTALTVLNAEGSALKPENAEEYMNWVDGLGGAPKDGKLKLSLVESLATSADSDSNGKISFEEFKKAFD